MKVKLIAYTQLYSPEPDWFEPYERHAASGSDFREWAEGKKDADELGEIAGRLCYKSWSRPNPATASNSGYLRNILDQGHYSVLEHASATFWVSGVSRSLTHELVRHRHLSFSQVSQRYVDESEGGYVTHPALVEHREQPFYEGGGDGLGDMPEDWWINPKMGEILDQWNKDSRQLYHDIVEKLVKEGVDRKTARGAARGVLPNSVQTEIIVSGNHNAWREVLRKRLAPAADAEIRELAVELLRELKKIAPNTYQDFE